MIQVRFEVGGRRFAGAVEVVYTGNQKKGKAKTPKK
jgi:hypothetical protein